MKTNTYASYKFRAECAADAHAVRSVLLPWLMEWNERRNNIEHQGVLHAMPDVTVEFSIVAEGPCWGELLWLVDGINNAHVAGETLSSAGSYTGKRTFRGAFGAPAKRPGKQVLSEALHAVGTRQQVLTFEQERALQLIRAIDSAHRLGDKAQPSKLDHARPSWIVPIEHKTAGMVAIRRISAPLGCAKGERKGDGIVQARVTTIHA